MKLPLLPLAAALAAACSSPSFDTSGSTLPAHPDTQSGLPTAPAPTSDPVAAPPGGVAPTPAEPGVTPSTASGLPSITNKPAKYRVEAGTQFSTLGSVAGLLEPGDVVDVVGDATYAGGVRFTRPGRADAKIVVRGVPKNGKRPVITGGANTIEAAGNHYVFEGLEITGGTKRCFFHHAHDVTLRDAFVHDCPQQGILGADEGSGDFTLEHSEVSRSGTGVYHHQIYMATDETAYPGAVFRMRFSYVHDGVGGNNVKSRAERNEIHYNWIEGARYHEVELVGPDGQDPAKAREDGELVGNVLWKTGDFFAIRFGGDGTGATGGRYRLAFNTIVLVGSQPAVRLMDAVESVEAYGNVFYRAGAAGLFVFLDEAKWTTGQAVLVGSNNFLSAGSVLPPTWTGTRTAADPRFASFASKDLRPLPGSPLLAPGPIDARNASALAFPTPLAAPVHEPPAAKIEPPSPRAAARPTLGAYGARP